CGVLWRDCLSVLCCAWLLSLRLSDSSACRVPLCGPGLCLLSHARTHTHTHTHTHSTHTHHAHTQHNHTHTTQSHTHTQHVRTHTHTHSVHTHTLSALTPDSPILFF